MDRRPATSVDDLVRQAYAEVAAEPNRPYPSMWNVAVNHPGALTHQILTDEEYQQKLKYDSLMRRLAAIQQQYPDQFGQRVFVDFGDGNPVRGSDLKVGPQDTSPYRQRGMLEPGMPLANAFQVLQAPFSLIANTARAAYDLPKAAEEAPYVANKATGGLWNAFQGKDPNPSWAAERKWAGEVPFYSPLMMLTDGNPGLAEGLKPGNTERGSIEGPEYLKSDFGWKDSFGTDLAGYALESIVDPVTGATDAITHAAKAASKPLSRAGAKHALRAAGLMGKEMAFPAAFTGLGAYSRSQQEE